MKRLSFIGEHMLNVSDDDVDVFYLFLHIELRAGNHWLYVAICTVGQDTRERARARERESERESEPLHVCKSVRPQA
jgi:hypothetical protein